MKILWLSHLVPYPPKGGALQRSYNLVREIAKYHELTLLAFIQVDQLRTMFDTVEAGLAEAKDHLKQYCEQVEFVEIPCERSRYGKHLLALKSLLTRDPYSINWLKSDDTLAAIKSINKQVQFDLVHFDTISLAPYIDEFPDIPRVLGHHNIESHMMLRRAELETNPMKKFYFWQEGEKLRRYEKKVCSAFDLHVTCSQLDSERLAGIVPGLTIHDIPNGVDVEYFYPQPKNEKQKHLIFAGRLSWYPNREAMLFFAREVWPVLKKRDPGIVMNVVGSSPPGELRNLASKDNNFRIHGFVNDVRDYISSASVYVCPIRDGGGTKLKMLDSFAMGMATVAHPIACEGLEAKDGQNVLLANTAVEFSEKIFQLVEDSGLRKNIGLNARNIAVEKYAFTSIGKNLSDLYMQLYSESR